jgi:hypothetical protein
MEPLTEGDLQVTLLATSCKNGDCPSVYLSDRGTLVIQGDAIAAANGMRLGHGEQAVEVPMNIIEEALRALGR